MKAILCALISTVLFSSAQSFQLTEQHINHLEQHGYVILEQLLDKEEVAYLRKAVDVVHEAYRAKEWEAQYAKGKHGKSFYNIGNALDYTNQLDYLIDHPILFDIIRLLIGDNIHVTTFNLFIRHPCQKSTENKLGMFHIDAGSTQRKTADNYPMQINVQFFLTDINGDNEGNFMVIPGTHLNKLPDGYRQLPECNNYMSKGQLPPGAIQLKAKAGDVLIHFLEVWHAVAPNYSKHTRKSIGMRYGQKSERNDNFKINPAILPRMTSRQRALLG